MFAEKSLLFLSDSPQPSCQSFHGLLLLCLSQLYDMQCLCPWCNMLHILIPAAEGTGAGLAFFPIQLATMWLNWYVLNCHFLLCLVSLVSSSLNFIVEISLAAVRDQDVPGKERSLLLGFAEPLPGRVNLKTCTP